MAYEIFPKDEVSEHILIEPKGRILLNSACARRARKDDVKALLLFWDADLRAIGLRPAPIEDNRAFRVSYGAHDTTAYIRTRALFNHIHFDCKASFRVPVIHATDGMLFEFKLPEDPNWPAHSHEQTPKRTYIDDAVAVLLREGSPLHVLDISMRISVLRGKPIERPWVESTIVRHVHDLKERARLVKAGPSTFGLPEWIATNDSQGRADPATT